MAWRLIKGVVDMQKTYRLKVTDPETFRALSIRPLDLLHIVDLQYKDGSRQWAYSIGKYRNMLLFIVNPDTDIPPFLRLDHVPDAKMSRQAARIARRVAADPYGYGYGIDAYKRRMDNITCNWLDWEIKQLQKD
jgi:hypothetical protein